MDKPITNKATGLAKLKALGFEVPTFQVFSVSTPLEKVKSEVARTFGREILLVVRSSAESEDSEKLSNAGAFHSEVGVRYSDLETAWEKVCASMPKVGVNQVVIQEFIDGEFSGVAFSDSSTERVIIEYLPGLCKAVVEGFDTYCVYAEEGNVPERPQAESKNHLLYDRVKAELVERITDAQLSEENMQLIVTSSLKLAESLAAPQDIEWTIKNDKLYFLQTRPITANPWQTETVQIYDSANVGESFGGLVQPLTVSFAKKLYAQVYKDLLFHSGVSSSTLHRESSTFNNLVDSAYGRMYYRMENWYRFMSMLPGYKRNKRNLEKMLLLNEPGRDVTPPSKPGVLVRTLYYPLVLWKLIRFGSTMRSFETEVTELLEGAQNWKISAFDEATVLQKLDDLFCGILRKWYLTVENDTVVMSLYAILSKKGNPQEHQRLLRFHSVSIDQIDALSELSMLFNSDKQVMQTIHSKDRDGFLAVLESKPALKAKYHGYMHQFGGRFANELKLETPDLEDSFSSFAKIILLYSNSTSKRPPSIIAKSGGLTGIFHRFASRRETFRLHRANMFSLVRKLILRLADIHVANGLLKVPADIFFLEWQELDRNALTLESRRQLIHQRKSEYDGFESLDPPAFFKVKNGRWPQLNQSESSDGNTSSGIGVSGGKAQGKAKVMPQFSIPDSSDLGILVTERTDPGWTAVMAMSKGIVVEHGGMLSHASIVARELGIPAVIGLKRACRIFKTGDHLSIDGTTGVVIKQTGDE